MGEGGRTKGPAVNTAREFPEEANDAEVLSDALVAVRRAAKCASVSAASRQSLEDGLRPVRARLLCSSYGRATVREPMANRKDTRTANTSRLVRTSVLLREDTDLALRELAEEGKRPLSYEIRAALEAHVEAQKEAAA